MTDKNRIAVVVGIIVREDGCVLLQERQEKNQFYSNYWEFPGGKVNPGEPLDDALKRELKEEIGVSKLKFSPWLKKHHDYPHASVILHFYRITTWESNPQPLEGQKLAWHNPRNESPPDPFLEANIQIWRYLSLPTIYKITAGEVYGFKEFLSRLSETEVENMAIQIRDKSLPDIERDQLAEILAQNFQPHGTLVMVNDDQKLAKKFGINGLHLSSRELLACKKRPTFPWVSASCHDEKELVKAENIGVDFATLSPVKKTPSHPHANVMGWENFAKMARNRSFPIYALGGLTEKNIPEAKSWGAQGIATMRNCWHTPKS